MMLRNAALDGGGWPDAVGALPALGQWRGQAGDQTNPRGADLDPRRRRRRRLHLGGGAHPGSVIGGGIGAWALAGAGMDIARSLPNIAVRSQKFAAAGRAMAHAGVGFIALGAAADASRPADVNVALAQGESTTIAGPDPDAG
jgi:hypothetical protein